MTIATLFTPERLNEACFCIAVDQDRLWREIDRAAADMLAPGMLSSDRPHLFSTGPVFLARRDIAAMQDLVSAIEAAAALPAYREAVMAWAPAIARADPGPAGAFMGYDFHLTPEGPRLIEINTNAGGAFLNALLARAQLACCPEIEALAADPRLDAFDAAVWSMFLAEWRAQGREGAPATIAIVDDAPEGQYLYPEFLLARALFERHGARAFIVDPSDLDFSAGVLRRGGETIDLVYNRLVDFDLSRPAHAALREAYAAGAVVATPNPHNHALLADKRNLTLLCDAPRMAGLGLPAPMAARLTGIPHTVRLEPGNAEALWADRRSLFFKPAGGHAGKAVYRGDKITRGVWRDISAGGGYVAQRFAPPGQRTVMIDAQPRTRKMDVRLYAYAGQTLLLAARLYAGQTTNFRTPGGGFSPVIALP